MEQIDISEMIKARSDQLNAIDLIQPITVKIQDVAKGSREQPLVIHIEGNQPYKPSMSMRRVLGRIWGKYANEWIGRSLTLYCDDSVQYAGKAVGGIKISHASHIDKQIKVSVRERRNYQYDHTILPIVTKYWNDADLAKKLPVIKQTIESGAITFDDAIKRLKSTAEISDQQMVMLREYCNSSYPPPEPDPAPMDEEDIYIQGAPDGYLAEAEKNLKIKYIPGMPLDAKKRIANEISRLAS